MNADLEASSSTDLSPVGITTALGTMPPTPFPIGGGETFSCDGTAIPDISRNLCSTGAFVAEAAKDGALADFHVLDSEGIYTLPGR